ncbi:MAG: acyl-CoA dehydrogenase family protein [Nitrospinota bacterium]
MDFDYSQDQKLVRDMVRQFGKDSVEPSLAEMDENEEIPRPIWREMASLGLFGLASPESLGGSGVSLLTQVIVAEELGRVSASLAVTVAHHGFLLPALLMECGGEDQRSRCLPEICSGKVLGTVAPSPVSLGGPVDASRGSDAVESPVESDIAVVPDGPGWRLDGKADWVVNGKGYGIGGLFARMKDSVEAFLVSPGAGGLSAEPITGKLGLRPVDFARWTFSGCPVDANARLRCGEAQGGASVRRGLRLLSDLFLGAVGVGLTQACADVSIAYAKERKQFGRPIGSFQLVQDLIARMVFDVEAARLLVYRAAFEAGGKGLRLGACRETIARARSFSADAALRAGTDTVQVHGGYGFSSEYPAERLFRDARALALLSGGTGELLRVSAAPVVKEALSESSGLPPGGPSFGFAQDKL